MAWGSALAVLVVGLITSFVWAAAGDITTVAGNGNQGQPAPGPATSSPFNEPTDVGPTSVAGGFLVTDRAAGIVARVVDPGAVLTVVAQGLNRPVAAREDAPNTFLVAEQGTGSIKRVTIGGPAIDVVTGLNDPQDVEPLAGGRFLVAEFGAGRVLSFAADGGGRTVVASGIQPHGLAALSDGGFLVADESSRVYRFSSTSAAGTRTTVAGVGVPGFAGDGGPATLALLNRPEDVAVSSNGTIFVSDTQNHRVRRIATDGTITTIAGDGTAGFGGDNGPGTAARLRFPLGVSVTSAGHLLIADSGNDRVRRVEAVGGGATTTSTSTTSTGDGGGGGGGAPTGTGTTPEATTASSPPPPSPPPTSPSEPPPATTTATTTTASATTTPPPATTTTTTTAPPRTTTTSSTAPTAPPAAPLPSPGRSVVVRPVSGSVVIREPGGGLRPLAAGSAIPVGSVVDATRGAVELVSAAGGVAQQSAVFFDGRFRVDQDLGDALVDLVLLDRLTCSSAGTARAAQARRTKRRLFGRGRGRFRIRGRYASAAIRGTTWGVTDFCNGTRVTVREGVVRVATIGISPARTFTVRAGDSRFVPAPRRR